MRRIAIVITHVWGPVTPLITTPEPPSRQWSLGRDFVHATSSSTRHCGSQRLNLSRTYTILGVPYYTYSIMGPKTPVPIIGAPFFRDLKMNLSHEGVLLVTGTFT